MTLVPSHAEPAGQTLQLVRVVSSPPDVNQPASHTEHCAAEFSLHRSSAPHASHPLWSDRRYVPAKHGAHDIAPSAEYVPLPHGVIVLEPSQKDPAGHGEQALRVVLSPPEVLEPDGQSLQLLAPAALYFVSSPHAAQTLEPAPAK